MQNPPIEAGFCEAPADWAGNCEMQRDASESEPRPSGRVHLWAALPSTSSKNSLGFQKEKHLSKTDAFLFGAADEARTRYLHLGKVALYQMSYSRIFYRAELISAIFIIAGGE